MAESKNLEFMFGMMRGPNFQHMVHYFLIALSLMMTLILVDQKQIEIISFKDNINLPEIAKSTSAQMTQAVDQASNGWKPHANS